jgi:hypothetical protein
VFRGYASRFQSHFDHEKQKLTPEIGGRYAAHNNGPTTPKSRYNNPCNNKIPANRKLISSPSVANFIVKSPYNNKIPAIKNKILGPFGIVKPRFQCAYANCQI